MGRVEEKSNALITNNAGREDSMRATCRSLPEWASCIASLMVTCPRFVFRVGSTASADSAVCRCFFYLFFSRRSPTWERCFHFVCWWEFRKVLAFLPLGCWTHRVNWVKYLRRVDLCLFTSRHGMTSHKIWNIQQLQCENSKFHILFGIIKTRVRFDMHGNYYYLLFCICSLGDCL